MEQRNRMQYNAMHKFVLILDNNGNRKINNIKMFY